MATSPVAPPRSALPPPSSSSSFFFCVEICARLPANFNSRHLSSQKVCACALAAARVGGEVMELIVRRGEFIAGWSCAGRACRLSGRIICLQRCARKHRAHLSRELKCVHASESLRPLVRHFIWPTSSAPFTSGTAHSLLNRRHSSNDTAAAILLTLLLPLLLLLPLRLLQLTLLTLLLMLLCLRPCTIAD